MNIYKFDNNYNILISLLGIYPAEILSLASKDTWTKMFLETLFVRAKN